MTPGSGLVERYGERDVRSLREIVRITGDAASLVERGRTWYDGDPDGVPHLACESLVIKLGECVARLSEELRADHPEIPWSAMKRMRDFVAHHYEATDYAIVWQTLASDFPPINRAVSTLLSTEG